MPVGRQSKAAAAASKAGKALADLRMIRMTPAQRRAVASTAGKASAAKRAAERRAALAQAEAEPEAVSA